MKMLTPNALVVVAGFVFALAACAQEPIPGQAEYDVLASIAGEYTYDYKEVGSPAQSGKITFEPFAGGWYLKQVEEWNVSGDSTAGLLGIIGYDPIGGYFTWYRVFDNGAYDHARGALEDGTVTFDMTETRWEPFGEESWAGPGVRLRFKWTDISADGVSFMWERSVDGAPWERTAEGRNARVR